MSSGFYQEILSEPVVAGWNLISVAWKGRKDNLKRLVEAMSIPVITAFPAGFPGKFRQTPRERFDSTWYYVVM